MKQSLLLSKATRLSSLILSKNADFHEAPFKHCVVDNCFNDEFSYQLIKGFPDLKSNEWESTNDQDIEIKSPGIGIHPKFLEMIINKKLLVNVEQDHPISWEDLLE